MVRDYASPLDPVLRRGSAAMSTSIVRRSLTLVALVSSFCVADVALGTEIQGRELPTQLINTPDVDDLTGACSKCRVASLAAAQTATEDGATVELYYADERGSFFGTVELTILLADGTYDDLYVTYFGSRPGD